MCPPQHFCVDAEGRIASPHRRGRGEPQRWPVSVGVSGQGPPAQDQDPGVGRGHSCCGPGDG